MPDMEKMEASLFSLELVVEKLYVPHTTCRFPAVAFRLLDFPTIVIKHVEDDLGKVMRKKISFDPYYELPEQFVELKDKHGNFMIKKGKSCLFKISADVLKQHLANTPLYVMVIDLFPEVPKLIGNSTVPLNSLMDSICVDIAKLGSTVPSVHGDKGLFKLYNLMGKEIGYFVLGFRLLCLGPSLIPHLPESALLQRQPGKQQARENKNIDNLIQRQEEQTYDEENIELRNSACMTEPIRHDAFNQTIEMEDKAVHVEVLANEIKPKPEPEVVPEKEFQNICTQTEQKKRVKEVQNVKQKWIEQDEVSEDEHEVLVNNIVCPPALFYNSEAAPTIRIERSGEKVNISLEDLSVDDLSEIESFHGQGLHEKKKKMKSDRSMQSPVKPVQNVGYVQRGDATSQKANIPQARPGELIHGLQVAPQANAVFPLLTALINELSCIQNPQLLLNVSNQMQAAQFQMNAQPEVNEFQQQSRKEDRKLSPSVVTAVAAALTKKFENSKDNIVEANSLRRSQVNTIPGKKQEPGIQKGKTFQINETPKKGKLVYGLTNTQRLRLQKTNPSWLKKAESEVAKEKAKKQQRRKPQGLDELNTTNLSDTLTEVRRLAEKELDSTVGGDTLRHIASEVEELENTRESPKMDGVTRSHSQGRRERQSLKTKKEGSSPLRRPSRKTPSPKARLRSRAYRSSQQKIQNPDSSDSEGLLSKKRPVPLERHIRSISSPLIKEDVSFNEDEDVQSVRSDLPSSRSRSIEVRLPSAEPDLDDSGTLTDAEDEEDIPLPDDSLKEKPKVQVLNFPRYVSRDSSLPESIEGIPNASLNVSGALDDNSPLESTRHSRNLTEEQNDSRVLQSTDYDTRQFHSTDEPELEGLVSEEDDPMESNKSGRRSVNSLRTSQKFPVINPQLSENSPVPSVRRSATKLDIGGYLPSMSMSKGQISPVSSRPSTPKGKKLELQSIRNKPGGMVTTPRTSSITPRSASASPKRPTPRPRRPLRESIHTDSLSSYLPSDPENVMVSLSSNSGNYSDDFQPLGSAESGDGKSSVEELPKIISSSKLGYTIS